MSIIDLTKVAEVEKTIRTTIVVILTLMAIGGFIGTSYVVYDILCSWLGIY